MNFDLDDGQRELESTVRRYFDRKFPLSKVRSFFEGDLSVGDELWIGLRDLGALSIAIPERYGGSGGSLLDAAVIVECLGFAAAPGPFLAHVVASLALSFGNDAQREKWLPSLSAGTLRATVGFGEGEESWDPDDLRIGGDTLRGTKRWVLDPTNADVMITVLKDGLAVIDLHSANVRVEPVDGIDRTRPFASVIIDDPRHERLSVDAAASRRVLDAAAILLAADAYGGAEKCLLTAVDYVKQREQFGVTIAHFQAIKHQLADMALDVQPARGLYWYAADAYDHVPGDASRFASLAKAHITTAYVCAARRAIELHGGIGYTWESDMHFYLRRAIFDRVILGAPSVHRERYAELSGWASEDFANAAS